jgi:hypothetical protein
VLGQEGLVHVPVEVDDDRDVVGPAAAEKAARKRDRERRLEFHWTSVAALAPDPTSFFSVISKLST